MTFVEVLLPLALSKNLTYAVPESLEDKVGVGFRVVVPLGRRNKFYTGIVVSIHSSLPANNIELKSVESVLDSEPIVIYPQLKLWDWIADYYLCSQGEVMKAAIPAGLKLESETFVELDKDYEDILDTIKISDREALILTLLREKDKLSLQDIEKSLGLKNICRLIADMMAKGLILISERLNEKYRVRRQSFITISGEITNDRISEFFDVVKSAPKQEYILQYVISVIQKQRSAFAEVGVPRKDIQNLAGFSQSALDSLIKKNILTTYKKAIHSFGSVEKGSGILPTLSKAQNKALKEIIDAFSSQNIALLRGVTSSGKTEIYQHIIDIALRQNAQTLFLVPEIALTTQLTRRLQAVFGERVIIYHSKFSDNERVEIWYRMLKKKEPCVVIGARSSVFLPFFNLKFVIVDEEHESSYKQYDPAPRYNARDVAVVLASMHGAKTLLASATPSIETYWKALHGKFGLIELTTRYGDAKLPVINIVDLAKAHKERKMGGGFALESLKAIRETVETGHQVIVFQNRRGFAPVARCNMCAWSPKCDQCDVALTYHKNIDSLVCHYCGKMYALPKLCPQCGEPAIDIIGYGTERIEEEIQDRMPGVRMARLDLDTTRNKDSYSRIIDEFSNHRSDILVGTQMVTKGLDFGDVNVVIVTNADSIINFPDFRANERAFNMLEQVAGRAGRRENPGKVIVQSYKVENPLFIHLINHDYKAFYNQEIEERRKFLYPPFGRIINIYLKHRDKDILVDVANKYATILRNGLGPRVLGPDEPLVSKIQNLYIRSIMLKLEPETSLKSLKNYLRQIFEYAYSNGILQGATIYYDVDPA